MPAFARLFFALFAVPCAALALLAPAGVSADVVDPEPASCPPGSRPSTAHSGPYCAPSAACSTDGDCGDGTCGEVMQCVETRDCGGRTFPDAAPCTLDHVVGPCAGDGTCAVGECRARQVCDGGGGDGGCGCRAAGTPSRPGLPWLVLGGLGLGLLGIRRARVTRSRRGAMGCPRR